MLQSSRSRISISFDAWASDNNLFLLGIVAHFLDHTHQLQTLLLGLPQLKNHIGVEQVQSLLKILQCYNISG